MSVKALRNQLLAAIAMVLVAALALGSSTFAWFASNSIVEAKGMKVQAKAEEGIVIARYASNTASDWQTTVQTESPKVQLYPTSTNGLTNTPKWWHNVSLHFDDSDSSQNSGYTELAINLAAEAGNYSMNGIGYTENGTDSPAAYTEGVDGAYYLLNHFYIKSSGEAIAKNLYLRRVTATPTTSGSNDSTNLNKSIRVLIKVGDYTYIYCPIEGADTTYDVATAADTVVPCENVKAYGTVDQVIATAVPRNNATPIDVSVYVYFEGEDANCKSSNITENLNDITVDLEFGIKKTTDA